MFQFKFNVSQDKTPEDVASLENENTSLGLSSQKDEDEFITPKKKSKKKKHIDEENALENEKGKEIKENGINDTHEENHDTEGYNTSMMDEETLGASHKKKKKKKKDSHKESTDEAQNNSVHEENCSGSAVEDEVSDVPHKKKKKKRSNSEGTEQAQVDGAEGMKNSMIEEDNDGVPHTKKKKKKKADLDESTNENGHTGGNSAIEDENLVVSHKKKKADLDKSSEQVCEENGPIDVNNISAIGDEDLEVPHKKKKKKKKADLDESSEQVCEENGPIDGNNISAIGDEDIEVPHKKKKKKKKADLDESSEQACEENGPIDGNNTSAFGDEDLEVSHKKKKKKKKDDLNETLEEAQESVQTSSKKKKKRKREDCEEARDDTVMENSVLEDETLVSMIKKVRQEVDDDDSSSSDESERGPKNKSLQEMDTETSRTLDEGNVNDSVEPETPSNMEESGMAEAADGGFTMINQVKEKKKSKVHHVLPEWLSNPTTVTTNLSEGLPLSDVVGMDPFLLKRLEKEKVKKLFPIQSAVIPELLASSKSVSMRYRPRDVCVSAPTGSGKTLAYALPIIQALKSRVVPRLRALILLPTQELAKQVYSVFEKYTKFSKLKICLAVGRQNFQKEQESLVFKDSIGDCAVDILVATPGRLSDHITTTEGLSFKYLRFFVLDEADLFLSSSGGNMMLKIEQLKKQIQRPVPNNSIICGGIQPREAICLPEPYLQQILLSATLMHEPEQLKVLDLHRPKLFIASSEVGSSGTSRMVMPYSRPEELKEEYVVIDSTLKPLVLYHMMNKKRLRRVLVFTKSTMATHTLSVVLSAMGKRYKVAKFSSKESKRKEILADFTSGKIDVLISSDAMARGLDITHIDQVVSYDVPSLQTYVHRIGRTGRAGKQGFALSLVENTPDARRDFKTILTSCKDRLTKIEVTDKELIPYGGHYQNALATLKETLLKEKNNKKMSNIKAKLQKKKKSIEKKKAKEIV